MSTPTEVRGKIPIFYGWWVLFACAAISFYVGGTFFYGFTTFFNPIREEFDWTYAVTSLAFSFQRLESGLMGPVAGFLVDRVGPRKMMLFGVFLAGLGFILFSRINSLWSFYGSFLLVASGMSFATFNTTTTAVANWFVRKRARAMSYLYVGYGASGVVAPLLVWLIHAYSWRTALVICGIGMWVVGIPLSFVVRHKPEQYGYLPDGETDAKFPLGLPEQASLQASGPEEGLTAREALRTSSFWLVTMAFFAQHIAISSVYVHIVPFLESVHIPSEIAALAVTGMTLSSLIGRLGFGYLGDLYNKRYLLTIAFALQSLGVFIFAYVTRAWQIVPFLLTYGPGYGGPIPVRPALQGDYFGRKAFGTIGGLMGGVTQIGGILSPLFAGWVFDVTGSYRLAFTVMAAVTIIGVPFILAARPPVHRGSS